MDLGKCSLNTLPDSYNGSEHGLAAGPRQNRRLGQHRPTARRLILAHLRYRSHLWMCSGDVLCVAKPPRGGIIPMAKERQRRLLAVELPHALHHVMYCCTRITPRTRLITKGAVGLPTVIKPPRKHPGLITSYFFMNSFIINPSSINVLAGELKNRTRNETLSCVTDCSPARDTGRSSLSAAAIRCGNCHTGQLS